MRGLQLCERSTRLRLLRLGGRDGEGLDRSNHRNGRSKTFAVASLIFAGLIILTTPLVLYNFFSDSESLGWSKWPMMLFALAMRFFWIYIFFGRWLAYKQASGDNIERVLVKGNG